MTQDQLVANLMVGKTVGAAAAIWTAVNDALSPLGAAVTSQPFTPEHVLDRIALATKS
jgi:carbon-monoxide dehydrogenase large subunit